jgi:hypothetical protein
MIYFYMYYKNEAMMADINVAGFDTNTQVPTPT